MSDVRFSYNIFIILIVRELGFLRLTPFGMRLAKIFGKILEEVLR